jgi:hypothetical protein
MISHAHKTLFVHITKCGGQSIESMFLEDLGLSWETRAPLLLRANPDPSLGPPRLAHLTAREYLKFGYLTEDQFRAYYSFALVRNPLTRVISMYNYLKLDLSFADFVHRWLPEQFELAPLYRLAGHDYPGSYYRVRPQHEYLFDDADKLLVDEIFELEGIETSIDKIRARTGIATQLPHVNKPKSVRIRLTDVSASDKKMIGKLYERDFNMLGYDLP